MQPVDLNLASRPFKNDTLPWFALVLGVALVAYVSWWNVHTFIKTEGLLADYEEQQTSIADRFSELDRRSRSALSQIQKFDLTALSAKSAKANEVIRWKSFSWTRLFNQLQEVLPWDVQMTSVHPVFRSERNRSRDATVDIDQVPISVEGVAKTLPDFLEFQRNLIRDPHFSNYEPQHWASDENSGHMIFRIRFMYDPRVEVAAPEDEAPAEPLPVEPPPDAESDDDTPAPDPEQQVAETDDDAEPEEPAAAAAVAEPEGDLASDKLEKITRGRRGAGQRRGGDTETP